MKKQIKAANNSTNVQLFKNDPNSLIVDSSKSGEKSVETEASTQHPQLYDNTQYPSQKELKPHYIQKRQNNAFDPLQ